jgi:hypothetical protein
MTYEEVIAILGNKEDIGSGRYIYKYETTDGNELILNFGSFQEKVHKEDYLYIQKLLK